MVLSKGIDCATPLTSAVASAFKSDGFEFACRYLVPSGWKRLTKEEAVTINQAGLQVVSVFETTADRALGGRAAGLVDGRTAALTADAVGQPQGSTIYFTVDFDATSSQMPVVVDYIRAASEATPAFTTGVYGSFAVVEAVRAAGACSKFWQTYAWSGGRKADFLHIYQHMNDISVNGIQVDLNDGYGNEGGWNTIAFVMDKDDANKVIAFLAAAYGATSVTEAREEFHRLANELRKASGQPEE